MKPVIAIALSGGIDSMVAAFLLKKRGMEVFGLHFITGFETPDETHQAVFPPPSDLGNPPISGSHSVSNIGNQLGIPVHVVDLSREFTSEIVGNFCGTYAAGRTPNPCLVCNPKIKFGYLLEVALKKGASALATGHYAGTRQDPDGNFHLLKGLDAAKDQSYFLAFLNRAQLSRAVFPLYEMTKDTVRAMAAANNLSPIERSESQDICFIKHQRYGDFLSRWGKIETRPGPIENMKGTVIGEHPGLHLFTIGQRKGINCPAAAPYYVIRINPAENRLTVGTKADLLAEDCHVREINWIQKPTAAVFDADTRLRYRHHATPATVRILGNDRAFVRFQIPQPAVTPGQGAIFYRGNEVLGGGWIEG